MFSLFTKNNSSTEKKPILANKTKTIELKLKSPYFPCINFDKFAKGIDNVHIDVYLSPQFTELTRQLIYELLDERSNNKRRFTDKPSKKVCDKLDKFANIYETILISEIYRVKETKRIDVIQLFQISCLKFILTTVLEQTDKLLYELRQASLSNNEEGWKLSDRITWINQNKHNLSYQVSYEILTQFLWAEKGKVSQLRESLLGIAWTIPEEILANPLLKTADVYNHNVLMKYYVLLSRDVDNYYGFENLSTLIDEILDKISSNYQIEISPVDYISPQLKQTTIFSWRDEPKNIDQLFGVGKSQENINPKILTLHKQANTLLIKSLQQAKVIKHLLAAYETPHLYEYYFKLIKPYLLYQTLCDDIGIREIEFKLQTLLKIRNSRQEDSKKLSITEFKETKKRLNKLVNRPKYPILKRFISDIIRYRRDLKYYNLLHKSMEQIHLLNKEVEIQLARSNYVLNEFLAKEERTDIFEEIRGHVIIKADLRGSTTITDELYRRGLNPATHFSRNFFNPINTYIELFGAEKVFIEGDAIILCLYEYQKSHEEWLAVSRACSLAKNMLSVVEKQNRVSLKHDLPKLELGIGICYVPESPKFLYDGGHKIMISPAIGNADRLSSCSWKLRKKYALKSNLLFNLMVFQQALTEQGEKGMTTFRYNLNGIELELAAFKKLQTEISLRHFNMKLPGEKHQSDFYIGYCLDKEGKKRQVVIRKDHIKMWQEEDENHQAIKNLHYYEVVTNSKILNTIKKSGL
ncbi:MAG: hypothetical protein KAH84_03570 [Thiomargarita sp.]|nr:hypothetical protein [Thiomargarita sp.]